MPDRLRAAVRPLRHVLTHGATLRERNDELRTKLAAGRTQTANLRELRREDGERLATLTAEIDRLRGGERAYVEEAPAQDALRHLFVVTYGRSGSTLLQGILCSQPGFCIRGENGGVLEQLYRYHAGIEGPTEVAVAHLRTLVRDTLLRPPPGTRVAGFKEIRWPEEELPEFLDFVTTLFPGALFVVNTRDLDAVARSGWWADHKDARARLAAAEGRLLAATTALGERAYRVHYDDYVADPATLRGLFAWLDEDFDLDRVRLVMGRKHSYAPTRGDEAAG